MGNPHNQDVIKVIFVKNNIASVIEVKKSVTTEAIN